MGSFWAAIEKIVESRLKIGIIHLQQKNYEDAIQDFTYLLKEEPQYDQALYYLGTTYEEKGETEQAIVNLRMISRNSPFVDRSTDSPRPYFFENERLPQWSGSS